MKLHLFPLLDPPMLQNPGQTVLLVEDDPDSREIYGRVLGHFGFRVLHLDDGDAVLAHARRHRPDLIVMDLGLPRLDGWAATELLKQHPDTARIPVLAITVHVQPRYRERARAAGCAEFLEKPCPPTLLLETVRRHLPEPTPL